MLTTLQAEHWGQNDAKVSQCIKHLRSLHFTKYLEVVDCDYKILALTNATYLRNIPASSSSLTQGKKLLFVGKNSHISESQRHFTLTQSFGVSTTKRIHAIEKGI